MNRKIFFISVVVVIVIVAAFFSRVKRTADFDSGFRVVMGTFARVVVVTTDANKAKDCIKAAFKQLELVNDSMSDYSPDSELSRVNRGAYKGAVKVSEPLFEVLQRSVAFSKKTDGAFDITVGPLVDLFRKAESEKVKPSKEKIAEAKSKVGFEKLHLDEQNRTVKFTVDGMRLDLGGIAKGYAIDKAVEAIQESGAVGGMVDIGGDIRCFGTPAGKKYWKIGLQDPKEAQRGLNTETVLILKLTDTAIATSGDYHRFVLIDDQKYSHIIDTKTGHSSAGLSSVTIIADNAADADALATAVTVAGTKKGMELIESLENTEAILIDSDLEQKLLVTSGAQRYIYQK